MRVGQMKYRAKVVQYCVGLKGILTPVHMFDVVLDCPPQRSGQLVCSPSHHWSGCITDQLWIERATARVQGPVRI